MLSLRVYAVLILITVWYLWECRSDPVEGARLLEEAFRDYDKRIRPNFGGSAVVVNVSIYLLSLPEIDTAKMTFKLSFFIRQMWTDPRFFFNSRRNIDTIMLDASTSERIWSPDTFFANELSSVNHDALVKNQFCRISQNGSVLLSTRVTLTVFTDMDSSLFPYDSHRLILSLESYGSQTKDLKYQWAEDAVSSASLKTPGFVIGTIRPEDTSLNLTTGSYSRLTITINAYRKSLPYELGFMLPTGLLALLCLCSLCMKNATLGTLTALFLVSLMTLMNALLLINSDSGGAIGNVPCLCPLQLYSLLSSGFGLACLIINIRKEHKATSSVEKLNEASESKSRTESTSENGKVDDLPYGVSLDEVNQSQPRGKLRCPFIRKNGCAVSSLLAALLAINLIYFLIFHLIR